MIHFDRHAGITFTNVKMQITELTRNNNNFFVTNIDEVYFNEELDFQKDKETKLNFILSSAFEELVLKKSITSNAVSFSLPQELFITSRFPFEPSLLDSDLKEDFKLQMAILYPFVNWNEYIIKYFEIDDPSPVFENIALVFALNRKLIRLLTNLCEKFNFKLNYVDHCHLASNNLLINEKFETDSINLSFYISQKVLSVLASRKGKPIYYQDIPVKNINEIPTLITDEVYKLKLLKLNPNQSFLFGENISLKISESLSELTSLNFKIVNPFTDLKAGYEITANKFYTDTNHLFTASVGAAIRL